MAAAMKIKMAAAKAECGELKAASAASAALNADQYKAKMAKCGGRAARNAVESQRKGEENSVKS
jgi:hypothetical protein